MPKLTAHFAKKLPLAQFSNQEFSACIEADVDSENPETLKSAMRRLFALAKASVEEQFAGVSDHVPQHCSEAPSFRPQSNGHVRTQSTGRFPVNGNENGRHVPATASQKKAIFAICKSLGLDPAQYGIDGLSIKQASTLIDELKSQQTAGR